jgi:ADP-ribose pyrophosphatase
LDKITPETIISETTLFEGRSVDFVVRETQLESGQVIQREIVRNEGAVLIVPVTQDNEVRLVRQFRSAAQKWVIELPAGGLQAGEDPDLAAPRELLEETGDRAATWHKLHGFYTAPGTLTEFLHLYLATDLTPGPNNLEFDEYIEVLTVPWAEVIEMIRRHDIEDAKTIAGLMAAGLHLELIGRS